MLASLELRGVEIERVPLMNKDSLDMTPADHDADRRRTARRRAEAHDGVVIVHGTDRLAVTGERIVELLGTPRVADRAHRRDAALRAALDRRAAEPDRGAARGAARCRPGVYVAMHNQVLQFPGVVKDRERGTFVERRA